jgi:sugar phosphate isomerase/epimerase
LSDTEKKQLYRRDFITGAGALALAGCFSGGDSTGESSGQRLYKISLAQWSLHKRLFGRSLEQHDWINLRNTLNNEPGSILAGDMSTLDFPVVARREFEIDAVEYVNTFFFNRARDESYLNELRRIADGEGVENLLIMCDLEGQLGDPDSKLRRQSVIDHSKWIDAAAVLGCKAIRVNAHSVGPVEEQTQLLADGLYQLCEYADMFDMNILIENHGGLSSNGGWVSSLMRTVDHPRIGTLPDFGNFQISETKRYDPYKGIAEMMPYARAVSAKSHDFDSDGNETTLDYHRLVQIVVKAGYRGHLGIEYEGTRLSEHDGILATKALLERIRTELY